MEMSQNHDEEEGEMPLPLNSTYGGSSGQQQQQQQQHMMIMHHHLHDQQQPQSNGGPTSDTPHNSGPYNNNNNNNNQQLILTTTTANTKKQSSGGVVVVKYRECLKNHAASMGGNATDGCGEFMPSGEHGTIEALTCSACNCHRNFHRKEIEGGDDPPHHHHYHQALMPGIGPAPDWYHHKRKLFVGHHKAHAPHQMIMSYNLGMAPVHALPSESDEHEDGGGGGVFLRGAPPPSAVASGKKRYRTKFTQEQKEKMLGFAERVGWKIQKTEESVVQQFCQEVGVKRRVLKVWMHNNKHNLAKKSNNNNDNDNNNNPNLHVHQV